MAITKKQISEKTTSIRGNGFKPRYGYSVIINGNIYSVSTLERVVSDNKGFGIGEMYSHTKEEFVNIVYNHINK